MERITNKDCSKISQQLSHLITKTVKHDKKLLSFLFTTIYIQIFLFFFCILLLWCVCFLWQIEIDLIFVIIFVLHSNQFSNESLKMNIRLFQRFLWGKTKKMKNPLFLLLLLWLKNTFRSKDKTLTNLKNFKSDMGYIFWNISKIRISPNDQCLFIAI